MARKIPSYKIDTAQKTITIYKSLQKKQNYADNRAISMYIEQGYRIKTAEFKVGESVSGVCKERKTHE